MAWYNPQRISFNPNPNIIKSAGAIGDFFQQKADSDYQKMLKERENQQLLDQINYKKQQDSILNDHWQKTYEQQAKQNEYANLLKSAQMGQSADNYMLNKEKLNFQQTQAEANKKAQEAKLAKQNNIDFINGLLKVQNNPELAQQYGATTTTKDVSINPQMQSPYNPYIQMGAGMSPIAQPEFIPNVEKKTTYDKDKIQLMGASDIPMSASGGSAMTTDQKNYKAYAESMKKDGLTPDSFHAYFQKILNKKNLGRGVNDAQIMFDEEAKIAQQLGIKPYQLENIDIKTLTPAMQHTLREYAVKSDNAFRATIKSGDRLKKMTSYARMSHAVEDLANGYEKQDTGLINRAFNVVNNYLGFGNVDELARKSLASSNYADFRNTMLKIMSGTAVSAHEATRFNQAMGTLYEADPVAMKKFQNQIGLTRVELETIKDSFSPVVFNIRYGGILRAMDNAYNVLGAKIGDSNNNSDYKSIVKPIFDNTQSPQVKAVVKRFRDEDGKIVVQMADGSMKYE